MKNWAGGVRWRKDYANLLLDYYSYMPVCPFGQQTEGETAGSFAGMPHGSSEWVREDPLGIQGVQRSHLTRQSVPERLKWYHSLPGIIHPQSS